MGDKVRSLENYSWVYELNEHDAREFLKELLEILQPGTKWVEIKKKIVDWKGIAKTLSGVDEQELFERREGRGE